MPQGPNAVHPSTEKVRQAALRLGLEIEIRSFAESTRTAQDAAAAIGATLGQIVKSLVFLADGKPILALVSGPNRADTARLAREARVQKVQRASATDVQEATGFSIGGVPPIGHESPLPVYFDRDLLQYDTVWAAAGTPNTVFAVAPQRLVEASGAIVVDLKEE